MKHSPDDFNERILMSIYALIGIPASHLDLGCGRGVMVKLARSMGVDAVGVDITEPELLKEGFIQHDLRAPLDLGREFELVTCIEVAEHIEPEYAHVLCYNIARHCHVQGRLVFSAALPGQGGDGHVHLKPAKYWRDMLYQHGKFNFHRSVTAELSLILSYTAGPMANWIPAAIQAF